MDSALLQHLGLRPTLQKAAVKKARHEGKTPSEYVRSLVERDILADKTFDEMLKPVRDDSRKSGVTEDELDRAVERARTTRARRTPEKRS